LIPIWVTSDQKTVRLICATVRRLPLEPSIPDTNTDARMTALEQFLQRYLGRRRPEFGEPENEFQSTEMPAPLRRFYRCRALARAQSANALRKPILHAGHPWFDTKKGVRAGVSWNAETPGAEEERAGDSRRAYVLGTVLDE
jgi:hypothetical protein